MVDGTAPAREHLTPHDLVTYFRCPFEMELGHRQRLARLHGGPVEIPEPGPRSPMRHSPLLAPPLAHLKVVEGRVDLLPGDVAVYEDEGERGLPVLFPPEQVQRAPALFEHHGNLIDPELEISGRPDFIVRRADGSYFPIEYKATHLFLGFHTAHGRAFDVIQAIAECRLVEAVLGVRPAFGLVLYGDAAGEGQHEGWVEVPYGEAEIHWLRYALAQVRSDLERSPVPSEHTCPGCEPNAEGLCRFASGSFRRGAPDRGPLTPSWSSSVPAR